MSKSYKVWVEIEEHDSDTQEYSDLGILPDCVGHFQGRGAKGQSFERIAKIVGEYGTDPKGSDNLKVAKRLARRAFKRHGTALRRIKHAMVAGGRKQVVQFREG